jgi:hypothetical protein
MAGLLTRFCFKAFPIQIGLVAKNIKTTLSFDRNLQQRELLPIFTAFPFNS